MFQYLLFAFLIILLVCVIYWIVSHDDNAYRTKSNRLLTISAGGFDEPAREALISSIQIRNPGPADRFMRAGIIRFNLLEGGLGRREYVNEVAQEYQNALLDMIDDEGAPVRAGGNDDVDPLIMIHQIEEFNQQLFLNDIMLTDFMNMVNIHAPVARQEAIAQRRAEADAESSSRTMSINKCFDKATIYTSDKQNVHDGKVNNDLRDTLSRLKNSAPQNPNPDKSLGEIYKYMHGEYAEDPDNAKKVQSAERIANRMAARGYISTYGESEDKILAYVWERTKHPLNLENRKLMQDAVINSLAEGIENGNEVCTNGRCARVLNSLVTLDYDKSVGGAMTFEAYRNQIFQEVKEVINAEIELAENSTSEDMRDVAAAYNGEDIKVDQSTDAQFKATIKKKIDDVIHAYTNLTDSERKNITEECYVYATL